MVWLRSTLFYLALTVHSVVCAGIVLVLPTRASWAMRHRVLLRHARGTRRLFRWICGLDVRVVGAENLPDGACVIAANHQSAFETLVLPALLPPFVWILKESLVRVPWFGWALRRVEPIAIDRARPRAALAQVRADGAERLAGGVSIVVFPEGTRFAAGRMGDFQAGAVVLARAAGVPLVPLGHDSGRFWPGGSFRIHPGTITVRIGRPITDHLDDGVPPRHVRSSLHTAVAALAGSGGS